MTNPDNHERLGTGVAQLSSSTDDDSYRVRGVAIGEDDITSGLSGKRTHWGRDALKNAVESGALDSGKLLKGTGGQGHKDMDALADPDNIIGSFSLDYEDGVGVVYEGDVIDEQMARLIDHGLVEVSPDLYRQLGDYNDNRDAHTVDEIVGMPYMTVLDRGASPSNSIETTEALAQLDYLDAQDDEETDDGDTEGDGPEQNPDADAQQSAEGAESPATQTEPDMPEKTENLHEQLAEERNRISTLKDEKDDLKEQLAEKEDIESEKDDLEEQLSAKESTIEDKDSEIEDLEDEVELLRGPLAAVVADANDALDEQMARDRFNGEELVEMVGNMASNGEDDDRSATEKVQEQLSAGVQTRGQGTDDTETEQLSDEQLSKANDWAYEVISGNDVVELQKEEQLSAREFAHQKTGVDPATCNSRSEFTRRVDQNGGDD